MAWSTVIGLGILSSIILTLAYLSFRIYSTGFRIGSETERLKYEIANRKAGEKLDAIADEEGQKYEEALSSSRNLDYDEQRRLLHEQTDPDNTEEDPSADATA